MGPHSPNSVAILETNLGKIFPWVLYAIFKKKPAKKVAFWPKQDRFYKDQNGEQTEEDMF